MPSFRKERAFLSPSDAFAVSIQSKTLLPKLPLQEVKERILGKRYRLSLATVGEKRAQGMNLRYRGKSYVPNVLSFPLEKNEGEIVLTPSQIRREQKKFGMSFENLVLFMVIHGMLHLKGYAHGSRMERREQELLKRFSRLKI